MPVSGADETPVSGTDEMPVSGADETPVSGTDEMPVSGADEMPVSGADEMPVSGAGFGTAPRQLRAFDFGALYMPTPAHLAPGSNGIRQRVLIECLERLEAASPTAHYHRLAQKNLQRWHREANQDAPPPSSAVCKVVVRPGDWGEVTHELTKKHGVVFASLNMANAYGPGGGYAEGMVAQEENMFRRTDCHFSLKRSDMDSRGLYVGEMTALLSAETGRVYLDTERPRVCIRGPEARRRRDLGYAWLDDDEVFPFFELRAAAVDLRLRRGGGFDAAEMAKRVAAQLDTLIEKGVRHCVLSAFGCGAFMNPAEAVAAIYRDELQKRATSFDVVAFAVFHAGYGPDNHAPFASTFESWPHVALAASTDRSAL